MRTFAILIISLFFTISIRAQEYPDSGFTNKAESKIINKQIRIPLNNSSGIPYCLWKGIYIIDGFEVDSAGNFYFIANSNNIVNILNDSTTTLAVFTGSKLKYRKIFNKHLTNDIIISANRIYLLDNSLYMRGKDRNDFYELDAKNGKILKKYPHIFNSRIHNYEYFDSLIVLSVYDTIEPIQYYELLNFKGEVIGKAPNQNQFNIADSLSLKRLKTFDDWVYLGRWNGLLVLWDEHLIKPGPNRVEYYKFYFEDAHGKIIGVSTLDANLFGCCSISFINDNIDRKLRNGNIYIVNREEQNKNVLITILSIEELYKDALQHPAPDVK